MMTFRKTALVSLAALLTATAWGQQPADRPGDRAEPADAPPAATQPDSADSADPVDPGADPTAPRGRLRVLLAGQPALDGRSPADLPLPRIVKRGYLRVAGEQGEALIEIDGAGLLPVRQGSMVLAPVGPQAALEFRVSELSPDQIVLEGVDASAGRKIIVR